jgi:IS1 family transposase
LDWEVGDRSASTLQRLIDRLSQWDVIVYCSDNWEAYSAIIPEYQLIQSKTVTNTVERNNSSQRHWFKRFGRRSLVVSRSLEMVDLTMALFALLHVNGTIDHLLSLLK